MLRCRPWDRNRGQFPLANRPAVMTPSSTLTVSRSMATRPVARVSYHRPGPWKSRLILAPGPAGGGDDRPVVADQPGGQVQAFQPADRPLAAQDRGRGRDVRAGAVRGRDAHRPPAGARGSPGGRVDDVVQFG